MAEAAIVVALAGLALGIWLMLRIQSTLEQKHRQMLGDCTTD